MDQSIISVKSIK